MWSSLKKIINEKERSNEFLVYSWSIIILIVMLLWIFEILDDFYIIYLVIFSTSQIIVNFYMVMKKHRQEKNQTDPQTQE
jgi:L-asparagine transporter-like permease